MQRFTPESAQQTQALAELLARRAKMVADLAELDGEIETSGGSVLFDGAPQVVAAPAAGPARPRPAAKKSAPRLAAPKPSKPTAKGGKSGGKSQARPVVAVPAGKKRGRGRPKGSEKQRPLEEIVVGLVQRHKRGLTLQEIVRLVLQAGYKSQSSDFTNMVQQAIARLQKKEVLSKDADTMRYVASEAA